MRIQRNLDETRDVLHNTIDSVLQRYVLPLYITPICVATVYYPYMCCHCILPVYVLPVSIYLRHIQLIT